MNDISQQEELSDYDAEWGSDDDTQENSDVSAESNQESSEEATAASQEAPTDEVVETPEETTDSSAESDAEDDIWANATEAQKEAFRRAENEKLAASNRVKSIGDRLANNGRQLQTLRAEKAELEKANRKPTEFEQEHEQYGKNINEMIERTINERLPPVVEDERSPEQIEDETLNIIETAHPDVGVMYNSSEMQAMLADDPVLKHDGRALLFSEALHSPDPHMAVIALNHFKATTSTTDTSGNPLEDMQSAESSSGKHDMRKQSQLSATEQYDREWEQDDI